MWRLCWLGRSFESDVGGSNKLQGQVHGPAEFPSTAAASDIAVDMGLAQMTKNLWRRQSLLFYLVFVNIIHGRQNLHRNFIVLRKTENISFRSSHFTYIYGAIDWAIVNKSKYSILVSLMRRFYLLVGPEKQYPKVMIPRCCCRVINLLNGH